MLVNLCSWLHLSKDENYTCDLELQWCTLTQQGLISCNFCLVTLQPRMGPCLPPNTILRSFHGDSRGVGYLGTQLKVYQSSILGTTSPRLCREVQWCYLSVPEAVRLPIWQSPVHIILCWLSSIYVCSDLSIISFIFYEPHLPLSFIFLALSPMCTSLF